LTGWVQAVKPFQVLAEPVPIGVIEIIFGKFWLCIDEMNVWRDWLWRIWLTLAR
jgi:hypothetical protein